MLYIGFMKRKSLVAANWKMNLTLDDAEVIAQSLVDSPALYDNLDLILFPSFPYLFSIDEIVAHRKIHYSQYHKVDDGIDGVPIFTPHHLIKLGAQNIASEEFGAYTGEVSAFQVKQVGCNYVLIGHSERRQYYSETDTLINKKIAIALKNGLKIVLCVGETEEEYNKELGETIVSEQIKNALVGFTHLPSTHLIIAYEPVWAIGTGKTATPEYADKIHTVIRNVIGNLYGDTLKEELRILYGGSVKASNILSFMEKENIDGALVGGASLSFPEFSEILTKVHSIS